MWYVQNQNELCHHGILGMKWGVRRFQNPDGTLTAAGRKRYGSGEVLDAKQSYKQSYKQAKAAYKQAKSDARNQTKDHTAAKKVAIGVGTALTVAAAAGIYAKYHNEINDFVKQTSGKALSTMENKVEKGKTFFEETILPTARNYGDNIGGAVSSKASSAVTKYGMIGRDFVSKQVETAKNSVKNAVGDSLSDMSKAGMIAVAGIGAKKISDARSEYEKSGKKDVVKEMVLNSSDKAISSFKDSVKNSSSNSSGNGGKANGSAGVSVGKEMSKKLGPARQEHFTPQEQKRYDRLFQDNQKVKSNIEVRQTVKALKKAGYSIDQIETYLSWN